MSERNRTIVVMDGDQTGRELLRECLRVLDPAVIGFELNFEWYDLGLENRRRTNNQVVRDAAAAVRKYGFGLKAATITPEAADDVGSPNAILRSEINGKVILRIGRRLPGVMVSAGVHHSISVVRMAVDDAYGATEWREVMGDDEWAYRTEKLSRKTCRAVAEFAFQHARRMKAKVFGGPKFTVSPVYEGMFKEELDAAAKRHPDVPYDPQLIDATYALLLTQSGEPLVIPTLNRDGDCMSDLVLQLFGSIAGSESVLLGYDDDGNISAVVTDAPHGTAPSLEGKNVANPLAMILAGASLLSYLGDRQAAVASRAIYEAAFEAVRAGIKTSDLGGSASTTEFTDEVIRRTQAKLEVWGTLGGELLT